MSESKLSSIPDDLFSIDFNEVDYPVYRLLNYKDQEVIDEYKLNEQISVKVRRQQEGDIGVKFYELNEPQLDDTTKKIYGETREPVVNALEREKRSGFDWREDKEDFIKNAAKEKIDIYSHNVYIFNKIRSLFGIDLVTSLSESDVNDILYYLYRDYIGFRKIDALMEDPNVEDITCNGPNEPVFVNHSEHGEMATNIVFEEDELDGFVRFLANRGGQTISKSTPVQDISIPPGHRVNCMYRYEATNKGSNFTIRTYSDETFTPVDLLRYDTFNANQLGFLWFCLENDKGYFAAGGTGAGKSTTLNSVLLFGNPEAKMVSVEDTQELQPFEPNTTQLLTRDGLNDDDEISMRDLGNYVLRQRPVYIIYGEARGEEIQDEIEFMNTGHTAFTTFHAGDMKTLSSRLVDNGVSIRSQEAIHLVGFQDELINNESGERMRRCRSIVEVDEYNENNSDDEFDNLEKQTLWKYNKMKENTNEEKFEFQLDSYTESTTIQEIQEDSGFTDERVKEEIEVRTEILQELVDKDIEDLDIIKEVINTYQRNVTKHKPKENPAYTNIISDNPEFVSNTTESSNDDNKGDTQ